MKLEIYNSYCRLNEGFSKESLQLIKTVLTYRNDIDAELNNLFFQLKKAKRNNNNKLYHLTLKKIQKLKESEWVCWFNDNQFPTGLLNIVKAALESIKEPYQEIDLRKRPPKELILNWNNTPHTLRYYQKEMLDLGLKEGRGVFESCVGSGKSLVMGYLIKEISVPSLVIVPSVALGLQLENDFKFWFGKNKVDTVDTKKVRSGKILKPIRIATIQSLASLQKSGELRHLLKDVKAVIGDEIHHAGSNSYTNLLPDMEHIYYRFGFTGTFLRGDARVLDMWGFLSNVLYRYPAFQAIQEGYLTPLEINIYDLPGRSSKSYHKEYDLNYCGNPVLLKAVLEICLNASENDQILILVKNKDKSGKILNEFLNLQGIENTYISGDDKKEIINSSISDFNEKKIKVLLGSSVIGEGIDIRSTDHLIMCQGGKSEVVIVQASGRVVRLFDGKKIAKIHDFNFINTKYMSKHLKVRENIYQRNFECPIKKIAI